MPSRFRFHGNAIGAAGRISKPFSDVIEVQAAAALPQIGGYGSARSAGFKYREILHFDLAHSEVTGSPGRTDGVNAVFETRITSTVEGLNIMGMVTADRVVATLASKYTTPTSDGEPSVRLIGTRFENLKIAGIPVEVDLAIDTFDSYSTHSALAHAHRTDEKIRTFVGRLGLKNKLKEAPAHILRWFHPSEDEIELPARRGVTCLSMVRGLAPRSAGLDCYGHVIYIKGFGTIRLAEIEISKKTRAVNMIQVDLGCPIEGQIMLCAVADGGDDY